MLKPQGCEGCPLAHTGEGFCQDSLVKDPLFTIYGEAPGTNEIELNKPFVGKAGFVLTNWLLRVVPTLQIALEKRRISFRNILHCLPPMKQGRPYPTGKDRTDAEAHCAQYRSPEIDAPTVILCGEIPQRYFFGNELEAEDLVDKRLGHGAKGVMGRIGREYERDGRRYIFAPHPAFVLRQPALVQHGQEAMRISANEAKVYEATYVPWTNALESLQ